MEIINSFTKGLDKDVAKLLHNKESYSDALNLRLITDKGQSTGVLANIKGNELFTSLPATSPVYKLTAGAGYGNSSTNITVTINGTSATSFGVSESFTSIIDLINNNATFQANGFKAWLSETEDYVYVSGIYSTQITSFSIIATGGVISVTVYIPAQTNLIPIGYTTIREEIFIFSTNETAEIPAATGGVGQIWKLTYETDTLTPSLTLIYNNYLNFTTYHPIPPTAAEGRYENSNIKKLYWTDNFNNPRSLNTVDDNIFIKDPADLAWQPPVDFNVPILQKILAGGSASIKVGVYQAAYRLKNSSSATITSQVSNPVSITIYNDDIQAGTNYHTTTGSAYGTTASKTIKWKCFNLDTDYDRIECFIIIRQSLGQVPIIYKILDEPVPKDGEFEFIYDGSQFLEELTTDEFFNFNSTFTHCKTITSKHNFLLAGNTRNEIVDFEFDARAYRSASGSTDFQLQDTQGNITTFIGDFSSDYDEIPETYDAINPNQDTYKYQLGSATVLGGTGKYISYGFGTYAVKADSTVELPSATSGIPFRYPNPNYNNGNTVIDFGIEGQEYPQNNNNDGFKSAYKSGLLKGYQPNETYRFAITFYDKQGRPSFSRWIGDIKFPDYYDYNSNPGTTDTGSTVYNDFRTVFMDTVNTNQAWMNILYIKFDVTIPDSIKSYIGGYSIDRVERTQEDKTIIGQGVLYEVNSGSGFLIADPSGDLNLGAANQFMTFQCPEFLMGGFPGYKTGDTIRIRSKVSRCNSTFSTTAGLTGVTNNYKIEKLYSQSSVTATTKTIAQSTVVAPAGSVYVSGTGTLYNYDAAPANSIGAQTVFISVGPSSVAFNSLGAYERYIADYYRASINQYGGNSYSVRTRNTYISTGTFQPIYADTDTSSPFSHDVFGGDMFTVIFDNQKAIKNWGNPYTIPVAANKYSFTSFFPSLTTHNTELRHGTHINKDLVGGIADNGTGAQAYETYDYNTVYSNENNIKFNLPKPVNFSSIEENDTRFWISDPKIDGEDKDSWLLFKTNDWIDADSKYGAVNSMLLFKDQIIFFQDNAFGYLPVNQRSLLQTPNTSGILIGSGLLLDRPIYYSTKVGSRHQWSTLSTDHGVYFFDVNEKNIYRFSDQVNPLTLIHGLKSYFKNNISGGLLTRDNPIHFKVSGTTAPGRAGITCVYDYDNKELIYTFHDSVATEDSDDYTYSAFTISYNEIFECFNSFYSHTPHLYVSDKRNFFSFSPSVNNTLYIHNKGEYCNFYNTIYPSTLKLVVNPAPDKTKEFTNFEWYSEVMDEDTLTANISNETWNKVRVYNDYQNTDYTTLTFPTNIKRKERTWQYAIPRNIIKQTGGSSLDVLDSANFDTTRLFRERLRDKYITVDFTYNNTDNYRFIFSYLKTLFMGSTR